jgi:DNA-binding MarR family transcriptional regulator
VGTRSAKLIVRLSNSMKDKGNNDQIVLAMFTLSRSMKDGMKFDSATAQLTLLQIHALMFIDKHEQVTMTEVAKQFDISLPTATALSDKLVRAGLIARQNDANDRRIVKLVLTQKGNDLLTKAMRQRSTKVSKMLSYLSSEEKQQLLHIMQRLLAGIQKQHEK